MKPCTAIFNLLLLLTLASSCQESWEERTARETRLASLRQCPYYVSDCLCRDSLSFDPHTMTRHVWFSFVDSLIDPELITPQTLSLIHSTLVEEVRGDVNLQSFKRRGCSFYYHYRLQSDGSTLFNDSVTAKEYANGSTE